MEYYNDQVSQAIERLRGAHPDITNEELDNLLAVMTSDVQKRVTKVKPLVGAKLMIHRVMEECGIVDTTAFAEILEVSRNNVYYLGKKETLPDAILLKLLRMYNLNPDWVLHGDPEPRYRVATNDKPARVAEQHEPSSGRAFMGGTLSDKPASFIAEENDSFPDDF